MHAALEPVHFTKLNEDAHRGQQGESEGEKLIGGDCESFGGVGARLMIASNIRRSDYTYILSTSRIVA